MAASELGDIGPNAKAAVPAMIAALVSTDESVDEQLIMNLKKLGVSTGDFMPKLKSRLKSDNPQERLKATTIILFADPADQEARLALTAAAREIKENKAKDGAR